MSEREVEIQALTVCLESALGALGCPEAHAREIAGVLVDGELRGYDDHGAFFIGELATWIRGGMMNPAPDVRVVRESASSVLLDGDRGCGVPSSYEAMRRVIAKARETGLACAGLKRSGHFIAAAPYVELAAREGLIGFACANVTPLMAPPGGKTRTFGTNPLAYGFPVAEGTGGGDPVIFDMATSATAGFKVRLAALRGESLLPGLILDVEGRPTTDPQAYLQGGLILPVGGEHALHKGFGLAMAVDALAGVLTGAHFGRDAAVNDGKEGQFFLAIDPSIFMSPAEFRSRMDELVRQVKATEPLPGTSEILVPGERGQRRRRALLERGSVPLGEVTWQTLERVCGSLDIALP